MWLCEEMRTKTEFRRRAFISDAKICIILDHCGMRAPEATVMACNFTMHHVPSAFVFSLRSREWTMACKEAAPYLVLMRCVLLQLDHHDDALNGNSRKLMVHYLSEYSGDGSTTTSQFRPPLWRRIAVGFGGLLRITILTGIWSMQMVWWLLLCCSREEQIFI